MTHIWQTPSGALYLPITDRGDERYVEIRPSGPGWAINALNAVELPEDAVQMAAPRVLAAAYEREDAQVKLIGSLERQIDRLRVQLDEKKKDEQDARIAKVANVLFHHPRHHTSHACGIEVITVTRHMPFDIGNAIKYVVRAEMKGGLEDLRKSEVYLTDYINHPPKFSWLSVRQAKWLRTFAEAEPDPIKKLFFEAMAVPSPEVARLHVREMISRAGG